MAHRDEVGTNSLILARPVSKFLNSDGETTDDRV